MAAITDLAAQAVREPISKREYVLATVRTADGLTGVGEAAVTAGLDGARVAAALLDQKQWLVGRESTAVEPIRRDFTRRAAAPALAAAQAAVNIALLDITGKLARAPVYEVLGGPTRFKARAAAPLTGATAGPLRASLDAARAAGFRAAVVPLERPPNPNQGQAFVRGTRRLLDGLRKAAGDDFDFILDCQGALSPGDAQMLAHECQSLHLLWLEEPCSTLNLQAVSRLSAETVTPIGLGRAAPGNAYFQDLLRLDAIDVLRPDIALHGITQIRKAAALAETYYVAVAPFHRGGPVATAAALHLAASIPNFFIQEVPFPAAQADRRMRAELVSPNIATVEEGFLPLPAGPGLGITLNAAALAKYRAA